MSPHATVAACPYCGGEDLHPHEASHGAWSCRACRRVFAVTLHGLLPPPPPADPRRADRELAERAGPELEEASAEEVVAWAVDTFGPRLAVASNMQDAVLVDVVSRAVPGVDVLFLETGYHFAETLGTRDAVAATMPVRVVDVVPRRSVAEQDTEFGPRLYERAPDQCCRMRKVEPLKAALAPYRAWVTGIRRDEAPSRAATPVVGWDETFGLVKVNPLARWTQARLEAYAAEHGVLVNPLVSEGYLSIGCAPCTRAVRHGEDARAGRWSGTDKTECGLHA